ncbi:MAG: zinc-ribbon domain-containing protein [Ruminococcaceae bacterium]|nr:zinc-ribbon domain-containing protein [Oscillospiraceae bacterium]
MGKFCKNCGTPVHENAAFCPSCGTENPTGNMAERQQFVDNKKKNIKKGLIITVIVLSLAVIVAFTAQYIYSSTGYRPALGEIVEAIEDEDVDTLTDFVEDRSIQSEEEIADELQRSYDEMQEELGDDYKIKCHVTGVQHYSKHDIDTENESYDYEEEITDAIDVEIKAVSQKDGETEEVYYSLGLYEEGGEWNILFFFIN